MKEGRKTDWVAGVADTWQFLRPSLASDPPSSPVYLTDSIFQNAIPPACWPTSTDATRVSAARS